MHLHEAAKSCDVPEVRRLVAEGADLDKRDLRGASPLHYAALQGHVEVIKVLVELGVEQGREGCCWRDAASLGGNQRARGGGEGVGEVWGEHRCSDE